MNSGNLNFLEPSGPLQACNGTAFTPLFRVSILRYMSYISAFNFRKINLVFFHSYSDHEFTTVLHQILGDDETKTTRWSVVCSTHGVKSKVYVKFERQKLKVRGHFGETFAQRTTEKIEINPYRTNVENRVSS